MLLLLETSMHPVDSNLSTKKLVGNDNQDTEIEFSVAKQNGHVEVGYYMALWKDKLFSSNIQAN